MRKIVGKITSYLRACIHPMNIHNQAPDNMVLFIQVHPAPESENCEMRPEYLRLTRPSAISTTHQTRWVWGDGLSSISSRSEEAICIADRALI